MSLFSLYRYRNIGTFFLFTFMVLQVNWGFSQAPTPDFSATPSTGCAPLAVSFSDLSTGGPTSWQWDLGNGTTSTQQNPTTTYFTPGLYTVSLTVTNATGSNTITKNQYITVNDKPTVNFTADQLTGCFPLRVNFSDLSVPNSGTNVSWEWDFGDGQTSTLQNPFHIYTAAGNRTVVLKVTNSAGCTRVLARPNYIQVSPGVVVNFINTSGLQCKPPETIFFTNLSTGPGTLSYQWNFGDGNTSILQNPSNTYLAGGLYNVQLIVQSSLGCIDTLNRVNALLINSVASSFSGPASVCANSTASFTNTSVPLPITVNWDFGDGTNSTQMNPVKTWAIPGIYNIRLINNYATCSDTVFNPITVFANPVAGFTVPDSVDCDAPFTVNFTDISAGAVAWNWNFGDGGTSTVQNPSHTYTANGTYTVRLIVSNSNGCSDTLIRNQLIRIQRPVMGINGSPTEGCVPYTFTPTPNVNAIDGIATYLWDFGDGTTSTLQNPSKIYSVQGNYTVKLIITTNDGCTDSIVIPNGVVVGNKSIANFSASPLTQCAGQPVQFTNLTSPSDRWLWNFGDGGSSNFQNPQYIYADTGTFTVRLIAWNNGCADTAIQTSLITSLPPVSRFTPVFNCVNKRQVAFTDNSVLPQSWNWNFGDGNTSTLQNPVHTYAAFGTYTVTLTTTNGSCTNTRSQQITIFEETPVLNAVDDTICKSEPGFFLGDVTNPSNISDYFWNFGDGTSGSTGLSNLAAHYYANPGLYSITLTVTDTRGCQTSVTRNNLIRVWGGDAVFTPSSLTGCKPLTVIFNDASTTDGVHNIVSWSWNYGDGQSQTLSSPPFSHIYDTTGNFSVQLKITDSYGCQDSITYPVPIFITNPKAIFNSPDSLSCVGKNIRFNNLSTGQITSYFWSFGDGTTADTANPVKVYATDGNYTIKLIITDVNGCVDSMVKTAFVRIQTTSASFTVNDSISSCSPFEVIFTQNSLNTTSFAWDFGDGSTGTGGTVSHYYTTPGIYQVTMVSTGTGGCTDTARKIITLYPSTATLTYSPFAGCSPLGVNFHVSTPGPVTYLWDLNDGTTINSSDSNLLYTYLLPGNFLPKVILEDQTGCQIPVTGADTIFITKSNVKFGASDSVFCDSGTVSFSDSTISNGTNLTYNWNFGDGNTSTLQNPVHLYANPGLYTVRLIVNTGNGCSDTLIKPDFIKVVPTPIASIGGLFTGCNPSTFTFTGNLSNPDTSAYSWQWTFGNGNSSTLQNPPPQTFSGVGTYNLEMIVTNSTGCADTVQQLITINPVPVVTAGNDTTLCLGTPVQLNASGAATYTWSPTLFLSCVNCASPFTSTPDNIQYTVTGTNIFGCSNSDSLLVTVKKPFSINLQPFRDTICIGQSVNLSASFAENYLWSPAAGLSSVTVPNPVASPTVTTTYKLLAYDDANCFQDSVFATIHVFNYPTVNAGNDITINAGTSVPLNPVYSNDVINWLWQPVTTLSGLSCSTCPNPVATPYETTTYTLRVGNIAGCQTTDAITIHVLCNDANVFIPNTFSPNNDGLNDYFYPRGKGLFRIQKMEIFNRWGQLLFQKANLTPNSSSDGWNGTYKGSKSPMDTYIYIIEVICNNSVVLSYKGNITLIR